MKKYLIVLPMLFIGQASFAHQCEIKYVAFKSNAFGRTVKKTIGKKWIQSDAQGCFAFAKFEIEKYENHRTHWQEIDVTVFDSKGKKVDCAKFVKH